MDTQTDAHHHHHHDDADIALPTTEAEADAFVAAVMAEEDAHAHSSNSAMAKEHAALLDLVARAEATHVAIGNGSWFDPDNWYQGRVPDEGAKVLIPRGVQLDYDAANDVRLFTVRVDGQLDFATDIDTRMVVDTMVIAPGGLTTIGTADTPVDAGVTAEIIIANNGAIDVAWDPMLLSRGLISHGDIQIHGARKDSHEKVVADPMKGDTSIEFAEIPEGWQVGDTIVIAGTRYDGRKWDGSANAWFPAEDEIRTISKIEGNRVHFDEPLVHDHDTPRADLKTSIANYTRNVRIATENGADAEVHERGHFMAMHSDEVDIRYAEFFELGRTNKGPSSLNAGDFDTIEATSNVRGRYSFHLHRTGTEDVDNPAMAVGNAVFGSPGWGFVHHDSNAIFDNNASYNTFGAGFVAESGNEIGAWTNNIAIFARGRSWGAPKNQVDLSTFDTARGGDGFWFQGRMVESIDNIAASVNHGFVYFHRGAYADDMVLRFDASQFDVPETLYYNPNVRPDDVPVLGFSGNEVFAAKQGLHVVKANPNQGHDINSVFQDFTAWSVKSGAHFEYTSHYVIRNFDLIGKEATRFSNPDSGISFGGNVGDMTIVDVDIAGFRVGIDLQKKLVGFSGAERHSYTVIDAKFSDVGKEYDNYDPDLDTILTGADLPFLDPDLQLRGPLTYKEGHDDPNGRVVRIRGTKVDSLGETRFPGGFDGYNLKMSEVVRILENDGYYRTSDGQNYFLLEVFFSDRLNGDIYVETHPVFIDDNVPLGNKWHAYRNAVDNGVQDLEGEGAPVIDEARLFATLEGAEWVFFRDGAETETENSHDDHTGHHDETHDDHAAGDSDEPAAQEPAVPVIAGNVVDRAGMGLGDARVLFSPDQAPQIEAHADPLGAFRIDLASPLSGHLGVSRDYGPADPGLSSQAALEVLRLAVGLPPSWGEATAYDFIAADIDGNGRVNSADAQHLLRAASGMKTPHEPRWVFVDAEADLSHINEKNVSFEGGVRIDDFHAGLGDMTMVGILVGQLQEF